MLTSANYSEQEFRDRNWPKWITQWRHAKCVQAVTKFQDTFFKLIRAGNYLSDAISLVRTLKDARSGDEAGRLASALDDIPLYLDMLWVYLRVQADVFATLASYLYERQGTIPDESFRNHRRWFVETRPDFHADYRRVLLDYTHWFEELAGEDPKGVRDVVIHQRGTYQLGWMEPAEGGQIRVEASLVRDARIVVHDVIPSLVSIIAEYCEFLDKWAAITVDRVRPVFGWSMELPNIAKTPYFSYGGAAMACAWMFPKLEDMDPGSAAA